jgi:hypothetical protein
MSDHQRIVGFSERVYRTLLVLYPKGFRESYGPHMVQVFRDTSRDEVRRVGMLGLLALWMRTVPDLVSTAHAERSRAAVGRGFAIPVASSPKMVRVGGIAAIVGGVLGLTTVLLPDLTLVLLEEPISNALSRYESGSSSDSPLVVLLHPLISESLSTLSALLFSVAFIGLYALVFRSSGRAASWGGVLMCVWVAMLVVFAGSNALRLSAVLLEDLDYVSADPLVFLVSTGQLVGVAGYLALGLAALRTRALGKWSILPLTLMPLSVLLRLLFSRLGYPVGNLPEALREGLGTLVIVGLPQAVSYLAWMLLGYLLWCASGRAGIRQEAPANGSRIGRTTE